LPEIKPEEGSDRKGIWHHITDHPKIALVLALLALAAAFSPRTSGLATWLCLVLAFIITLTFIGSMPHIRRSERPILYGSIVGVIVLGVLAFCGAWLTRLREPTKTSDELSAERERVSRGLHARLATLSGRADLRTLTVSISNDGPSDILQKAVSCYPISVIWSSGTSMSSTGGGLRYGFVDSRFNNIMIRSGGEPETISCIGPGMDIAGQITCGDFGVEIMYTLPSQPSVAQSKRFRFMSQANADSELSWVPQPLDMPVTCKKLGDP
jgi:hypothetical protein